MGDPEVEERRAVVRILFFGTPTIAVPYLEFLASTETVAGVVCKPDEPAGRGYQLTAPPTKGVALSKQIPVFQPEGPWTDETVERLRSLKADLGVAVAYGRILPESVFRAPRLGTVNIHFSLLPKYRGAAPIQWALIKGEKETGVTVFWLEAGLDTGPIAGQTSVPVDPEDNARTLRDKLVPAGLHVLKDVLKNIASGKIDKHPQQGEPSLAPQLKKEMGHIDWAKPANDIVNLIRGVYEWPGAFTSFRHQETRRNLKILQAVKKEGGGKILPPGTIVEVEKNKGIVVAAGTDALLLTEVQPEGKKPMAAWAFWLGAHLKVGDRLG